MVTHTITHNDVRDLARILLELTETKARMLAEEAEWLPSRTKASADPEDLLAQVRALCLLIRRVGNMNCPSGTHECSSGCCPDWIGDPLRAQLNALPSWPPLQPDSGTPPAPTPVLNQG